MRIVLLWFYSVLILFKWFYLRYLNFWRFFLSKHKEKHLQKSRSCWRPAVLVEDVWQCMFKLKRQSFLRASYLESFGKACAKLGHQQLSESCQAYPSNGYVLYFSFPSFWGPTWRQMSTHSMPKKVSIDHPWGPRSTSKQQRCQRCCHRPVRCLDQAGFSGTPSSHQWMQPGLWEGFRGGHSLVPGFGL